MAKRVKLVINKRRSFLEGEHYLDELLKDGFLYSDTDRSNPKRRELIEWKEDYLGMFIADKLKPDKMADLKKKFPNKLFIKAVTLHQEKDKNDFYLSIGLANNYSMYLQEYDVSSKARIRDEGYFVIEEDEDEEN